MKKLPELEIAIVNKTTTLNDLIENLMLITMSGDENSSAEAIETMERTFTIWCEIDELSAYVLGVKSKINVPQIGMSIAEAEVVLGGMQRRECFLREIEISLRENAVSDESPFSDRRIEGVLRDLEERIDEEATEADDVGWVCSKCGEKRGVPVDPNIVAKLISTLREKITSFVAAIDQTKWQSSVTWCEDDEVEVEDEAEDVSNEGFDMGQYQDPWSEMEPEMELEQYVSNEDLDMGQYQDQWPEMEPEMEPEQEAILSNFFSRSVASCPACMSRARKAIEKFWIVNNKDVDATLELGINQGVLPPYMNPQQLRQHFSNHFEYEDHGLTTRAAEE